MNLGELWRWGRALVLLHGIFGAFVLGWRFRGGASVDDGTNLLLSLSVKKILKTLVNSI